MAAAMNGMALHGGIVPYGGTFLVFTDYCRPAIRLSALMGQRVDLRDDARLHRARRGRPDAPAGRASGGAARHPQPQRVPPGRRRSRRRNAGSWRWRPADTPSILALTRQAVPALRKARRARTCAPRAPTCWPRRRAASATSPSWPPARRSASPWRRASALAKDGIEAAVVSMPCWELFAAQPVAYRDAVLGTAPRVGVEAAVELRLGALARRERRLHRHAGLRRLGPGAQALRALRHHGGQGRGSSKEARWLSLMDLDKLKTTAGLDVKGKRVLVRADLNVPVKDGKVTDATRLERLVPGLQDLAKRGAKVVVISHFGRPKGGPDPQFSLKPVADKLGELLGQPGRLRRRLHRRAGGNGGRGAAARRRSRCWRTCASTRARRRTIPRSPRRWPRSATSSSTTPSPPRIARTPRPRPSRGCCRPTPGRC